MTNSGTLLGYLRVSTGKQDEQLQHDALDKAGVLKRDRYVDHGISGAKTSRPGLDALLEDAKPGDTIVVYKLDRLGRSTAHVAGLIHDLTEHGIYIQSTSDGLSTSTPTGRAMLQMLAIFAEMERSFIQERTLAGLAAKRKQGIVGGRPKIADSKMAKDAQELRDKGLSVPDIARAKGVSIPTIYRITKAPAKLA